MSSGPPVGDCTASALARVVETEEAEEKGERQGRVLVLTGASGSLAADVLPGLVEAGYAVRAVDRRAPADSRVTSRLGDRVAWHVGELADRPWLQAVVAGADVVVHLAGIPLEDDWQRILLANIDGTQAVLEAARLGGVPKVVLASSVHAVGFVPVPTDGTLLPDDVAPRPNTFYGVSKVAVEALGSLYHDRHNLDVVVLRICSRFQQPRDVRMLSTWLSPDDALRLVLAAAAPEVTGHHIVWGVSHNARRPFATDGARGILFEPQDDAEQFAHEIEVRVGVDPGVGPDPFDCTLGGVFSSPNPPRQPSGSAAGVDQEGEA